MNSSVIIVAAGNGTRFKGEIPKQYVKINNETILNMTLKKFIDLDQIRYIQPVISIKHQNIYNETIKTLKSLKNFKKILPPCFGGNERCVSVKKGLIAISKLEDNPNKVLIHDAARPFISKQIIKNVINKLEFYDAVLPCINIVDTVWKIEKNVFKFLRNRSSYYRAQTPQGFNFKKILEAHLKNSETWAYDDIYLANKNNFTIMPISGSDFNIKITKPEDLEIAERYLK